MMPPNKKEAPIVPPHLIQPIEGVADWCNQVLVAYAASGYGDLKEAIEVTGRGYDAFYGQQRRHPELKTRIEQIGQIKNAHYTNRLKNKYKEGLVEGFVSVTTRVREGYADETLTTVKQEPRAMAQALGLLDDDYNPNKQKTVDLPSFTFNPGGANTPELEAGEIVEDGETE
jgi:hypothetical protein